VRGGRQVYTIFLKGGVMVLCKIKVPKVRLILSIYVSFICILNFVVKDHI
jgi:hypothetical protein